MDILWDDGPSTVKFVNDKLNMKKVVGYTNTLKLMQIMFKKELVDRTKLGRRHIYNALLNKNDTQKILLERLLETAFSGSASKLIIQALEREETIKQEIEEIMKFLEDLSDNTEGN